MEVIYLKVIVALDDNLGMMFNHRRQSRDRILISDIAEMVEGKKYILINIQRYYLVMSLVNI